MMASIRPAIVAAIVFQAGLANAQEGGGLDLSLDGFATLGVVRSSEDQADFVANTLVSQGAGHSDRWSPRVDSRLGLQITANVTPRFSSVVQLVAEERYDGTFEPTVEWANVSFDITPPLRIRAGRMVLPIFMISEHRKVGYANPWVRPPQEVYQRVPVTNFDGVELAYRTHSRGFTNTLQTMYGRKDETLPDGSEVEAENVFAVANTLERGAATFFVSFSTSSITVDALDPIFDGFRSFGAEGEAIADRFDVDEKRFETLSIGARYDPGEWFVTGEWSRSESRTVVSDTRGWYVTGGYRFGAVTPYATLAGVRTLSDTSHPGLSLEGLSAEEAAQAGGLNTILNQLLADAPQQRSVAVGARWDLTLYAALKVQYDYMDLDDGSPGVLFNTQPDFRPGGSVSLFSIALDFVF